ncbi:hypothetical protein BGX38DRAFT_1263247 [Terfezia claveryi]|nr:hypothetical protein BGX38DRAFT_1263247 [Terfezia claveryi]
MGYRKKKDSRSKPLPDPRLEQSSGEQKSQRGALLEPIGRLWDTFRGRSPSPSRKRGSNTPDQPTVTTSSQSLAVPASVLAQPHSSYSGSSALEAYNPMVPFGGHGSPSSSMSGGAPFVPISNPPFPSNRSPDQPTQSLAVYSSYPDFSALQSQRPLLQNLSLPTDAGSSPPSGAQGSSSVSAPIVQISHYQASPEIFVQVAAPPQTKSGSQVWAKALELAEKKLNDNNLPPLNLTNLTSQSAEENIEAVVKVLNTVQEDDKKKRWSYTWRGKEVVVVERLGKILKNMEQYTKVVDTAIQSNPQVSALVWAGVRVIMQVALNHVEAIEGFEVAIAALLEKMSMCEFYAGIYIGVPLTSGSAASGSAANSLQRQRMLESALPELYAAVIVFAVKARAYFEARGLKKVTNTLKSFDIEFQPFIEDINAKERVILEFADAATMEKIRNIESVLQDITSELKPLAKLNNISTTASRNLKVTEEIRNNAQDDKILELLTMLTPLEPLKKHQDVKMPRTKNAGAWLLSSESFCKWRDSNTIPVEDCIRVFCCFGIPGAGKTVIRY